MDLLYKYEHIKCLNYERSKRPLIEEIKMEKGQKYNMLPLENKIVFLLEGRISFSFGEFTNKLISKGEMVLLSTTGRRLSINVEEPSTFIVVRLRDIKQFCDCFPLDFYVNDKEDEFQYELNPLPINQRLALYLDFLEICVTDGLKCIYFFDIKLKELFFLFRAYYSKEELLSFFYPMMTNDITFSDFVMRNHNKVKTVEELATLLHYSLSGFQKRFRKVFGVSAYQWMKEERSKSIFHEINSTGKTFKEISDDYGFSSPSHFNDFCKSNFGTTPGELRKKKSFLLRT